MTAEFHRIQKTAVIDRRYSGLATANAEGHRLPIAAWYAILPFEAEEGRFSAAWLGPRFPRSIPIFP